MSKLAEAYGRYKHPKAKKVKGEYFSYSDLGNCYSYVSLSYKADGKSYDEQLKLDKFFEFIGKMLVQPKEAHSDIEESVKEYLKGNLHIRLSSGYAEAFSSQKRVEVKLLLEDEEISSDCYCF